MHRPSSPLSTLSSASHALITFATPSVFHKSPPSALPSRPINPLLAAQRASTNCLDGLRGVAAFSVMIFHFSGPVYPGIRSGYGHVSAGGVRNEHLLSLPLVKVWYSGGFMVFLFFVISGYVLAVNIVRHMTSGHRERILGGLSSLAFRRTARLFAPSMAASFVSFVLHRLGVQGQPDGHTPGWYNDTYFYLKELRNTFTFYTWDTDRRMWHLMPLWTIPVEFRCSMVLFLVLLATARCQRKMRLVIQAAMLLDCWIKERWDVGCFMLGLVAAEIHVRSQSLDPSFGVAKDETSSSLLGRENATSDFEAAPILGQTANSRNFFEDKKAATYGLWAMFLTGLYLGSFPTEGGCETPGYAALCSLTFQREPWRYVMLPAAFCVVLPILYLPVLQKPLCSAPARYLGRVSYAMYLMHELVNKILSSYIKAFVWSITGREGVAYHVGYVISGVIFIAISLWIADMFMRAVDIPATKFARWMETRCLEKEDSPIPLR